MDAFLSTLAGVAVGGGSTYLIQRSVDKRREKRESVQAAAHLYDKAITAVATAEAARWGPGLKVDKPYFPAVSDERRKEIIEQLEVEALKGLLESWQAVRAALAALHPLSDDLKRFWDKVEPVGESEFDELMSLLHSRREMLLTA